MTLQGSEKVRINSFKNTGIPQSNCPCPSKEGHNRGTNTPPISATHDCLEIRLKLDVKRSLGLGLKRIVPKRRRNKDVKKIFSALDGSDKASISASFTSPTDATRI